MSNRTVLALIVLLSGFSLSWADEGAQNSVTGPGMYSNYVDDGRTHGVDRDLSSTDPMSEEALVKSLLSALNQMSKYPKPNELPEIKRVAHQQLEAMICNNSPCGVLASYWHGEGVYLDNHLKPETNLFARSVLLHELVHYLQDTNDAWSGLRDCDRWYHRELEAYALQKQFLTIIGSPVRVAYSASGPTCDDSQQEASALGSISR